MKLIQLSKKEDHRGALVVVEQHRDIPIEIKRVYYMFDTDTNVRRGFHAHKRLTQVAISIKGSCKFLLDDGEAVEHVLLDSPSAGLVIEPMVWHEMYDYSDDCILMILADDYYDEDDYIRNYEQFKSMVK
ncbi:sugar 3,4-ketoisomerase [Salmonella enterica]|uniref:WxcM-like, C-terminal n=2 Tax=Salmonella enterica TaxID=28901 RepID=D7PEY0_SALER|nr:FdtA/QdtA family cupin domain-containing protein [Salmonella enterica]ECC1481286.1 WxcM-like domain-containing protein [Salmonella enterica subsp. salamae]ADI39338.1 dTDP-6-deoxy-D-xylo-hex-4-ulose 3,4-ketoisomerase [Salmonella enterica]ASG87750.1 dTDP-6-deoxy-3,4-keto-hexulose isomerase [Salmonella enterica subsp. salamae serovar 55:k:z39 str. 1315K]ECC1655014.1 WxcM-like domain-containing protein [Salmonella enterica subsp. salamae]ECD9413808.1 WxcM-like domain-containing protein [Salmone